MIKEINNTKFTKNSEICLMQRHYDENSQYHKAPIETISLRDFSNTVRRHLLSSLNNGYHINALVYPLRGSIYVLFPAEYRVKVEQHIGDDELKGLLDLKDACISPDGYFLWARRDFSEE